MDTTASTGKQLLMFLLVSEGFVFFKRPITAGLSNTTDVSVQLTSRSGSREWNSNSYQTDRYCWTGKYPSLLYDFLNKTQSPLLSSHYLIFDRRNLAICALCAMPMWMSSSSASALSTLSPLTISFPNGSHRSALETQLHPSFWLELSQTFATMWTSLFIWTSGEPNQCTSTRPEGWHAGSELMTMWSVQL